MADVASATLRNIADLIALSRTVSCQLTILQNRMREEQPDVELPECLQLMHGAPVVLRDAQEAVRDIASRLPIRGLDYGSAHA